MKNRLWIIVALMAGAVMFVNRGQAASDKTGWMTDFEAAQAKSAELNRPILIDFSGSDWCGWCKRLDAEVFDKEAFKAYADENLVLFIADFPRRTKLPEDLVKQNEALAKKYQVRGFPTVVLLDPKGNVLGVTGYQSGGPEAYIDHLKTMMK